VAAHEYRSAAERPFVYRQASFARVVDEDKRGRIISVVAKKQRVIVEGAHMIKKHMRKSQNHPQGAIVEREGTIHISNVMKAEKFDARAAKHGVVAPAAET